MTSMPQSVVLDHRLDDIGGRLCPVFGGVDTHKNVHVAAVIDDAGNVLGVRSFPTTGDGNRELTAWLAGLGDLVRVGIEGTGSYGAGLTRHLIKAGIAVVEVHRPDRADRRRRGKNDTYDAVSAARACRQQLERTSVPKSQDGPVEALRVLRVTRAQAVGLRQKTLQSLQMMIVSAPQDLRDQLCTLTGMQQIRSAAAWRPAIAHAADPTVATRVALHTLARRYLTLTDEITRLDKMITPLVRRLAPQLLSRVGIGVEIAGQLLVTAGDNPHRMVSEPAFAMLCGVAPLPASSGKITRHRLNRGGDRQANRALHLVAISRLRLDSHARAYAERRTAEGHSKMEIIRCLKRYIAREVYYLLNPGQPATQPQTAAS